MKTKYLVPVIVLVATWICGGAEAEGKKDVVKKKAPDQTEVTYLSMDYDANGRVNITDVQGMMDWLYLGGVPAVCPAAMDFDANGQVNVTDLMGLMEWLYLGGVPPVHLGDVSVKNCYAD